MLNYQRVNQFIIQRIIGFLVDVFTVEPVLWKPTKTCGNPFWLKPIGRRPDIHWEAPQCFDIFGHTPNLMILNIILPLKIAEHSGCTTHSQAPNIIFRLRSPKNIFYPQSQF
jgi:hypothetical protein